MKKFMVLFKASAQGFQSVLKAPPEAQKKFTDTWMSWAKKAGSSLLDQGAPLGKSMRVSKTGGASTVVNDIGGYSIMQGESKEAVAQALREHPHLQLQDASIEIIEIMPFPGS